MLNWNLDGRSIVFLSVLSNENANADSNNVIFAIRETKLYVSVVTLSAKDNQKLSKSLSKKFERSVYWNEYKAKGENKKKTNNYRYFLESNFVGVKRLFVLIYPSVANNAKRYSAKNYYLSKGRIKNYNVIINGKNFYDHPINSDIKWYEGIRKLTAGQGEAYTTGCLSDYEYIKNRYKLIAVDLSRPKELDADPKAIQQIEFVGQLKNTDGVNADGTQSMFVLTILEKINEMRLKFPQRSVTVL